MSARKIMPLILTIIVFPSLILSQNTSPNIVATVDPDQAAPGTSFTITKTLADLDTPPIPPSEITPTSVKIGDIEGTNISRNESIITADFEFPAEMSNGTYDLTISFPIENDQTAEFTKANIFTISDGNNDPEEPNDPVTPIDVSSDSCSYIIVDTGQETCYENSCPWQR